MEGFTNYGLTLDPNAICNPDGSVTPAVDEIGNPIISDITVSSKDEKVTLYTCGASTFLAIPTSGSATITYPISGTVIAVNKPVITGTGTVNGATIVVRFSGFNAVGTGIVTSGSWSIATTINL